MAGLRERIIRAHGGRERMGQVRQVMASITMGGWEFTSRLYPAPIRDVEVGVSVRQPQVALADFPAVGQTSHFTPERVWTEDDRGRIVAERDNPGSVFRSMRHWFLWDHLDVVYYCGLTVWHSINLPFVLLRDDVHCEELPSRATGEQRRHRLQLCCHGDQILSDGDLILYAEPAGLLVGAESAAPDPKSWFRLAQVWDGHESVGGLVVPTRRRFHACLVSGQSWPTATLAWLNLDDVSVVQARRAQGQRDRMPG